MGVDFLLQRLSTDLLQPIMADCTDALLLLGNGLQVERSERMPLIAAKASQQMRQLAEVYWTRYVRQPENRVLIKPARNPVSRKRQDDTCADRLSSASSILSTVLLIINSAVDTGLVSRCPAIGMLQRALMR